MLFKITLSTISGTLLALSLEPFNFWFFGFIAFIPLLLAIRNSDSLKVYMLCGFVAVTPSVATTLYPFTSAGVWAGWVDFAEVDYDGYIKSQSLFLYLFWVILSFIGGALGSLFTLFAWFGRKLKTQWFYLILIPACWILIAEQLRDWIGFGYNLSPISSILLHAPAYSQILSVGGSSLGTYFVLSINTLLMLIILSKFTTRLVCISALVSLISIIYVAGNKVINQHESSVVASEKTLNIAIVQFSEPPTGDNAFTSFAMNTNYFEFTQQTLERTEGELDLIVLPESIGFGSVSFDGSKSSVAPDKTVSKISDWNSALIDIIKNSPTLVVLGADTTLNGKDRNSLLAFTKQGLIYFYNKIELVPFAERLPGWAANFGFVGDSSYYPGSITGVMQSNRGNIGFFICQEGLFPEISRDLVNAGSELMVSIGNDGVFENKTSAEINHKAARMRAIESQKYIIRAMKSGISSIIKPTGLTRSETQINENTILFSKAHIFNENKKSIYHKTYWVWESIWLVLVLVSLIVSYRIKRTYSKSGKISAR